MKVVATRTGFYDNFIREPGEVFELLQEVNPETGELEDPVRVDLVPKLGADGKPISNEFEEVVYKDKAGNTMHRDFSPDTGEEMVKAGPLRGEVHRFGWMKRVPDDTEVGCYEPGTRFGAVLPQPRPRATQLSQPVAAPIRGKLRGPRIARG